MKSFSVYIHTNNINNKKYVGQTCQIPKYRWGNLGQGYKNGNKHFWNAINKYGWDNFSHEIILNNLTQDEANYWEKYYIKKYNTTNPLYGYNNEFGGVGKEKNISYQTRKKQSISAMNRPPVSDETKSKLSAVSKNRKKTKETRDKMSASAFEREKNRKSFRKKVVCINTGHVFSSIREAADWCGLVGSSGISLVCNNKKQKTAGVHPITGEKLTWRYAEEKNIEQP